MPCIKWIHYSENKVHSLLSLSSYFVCRLGVRKSSWFFSLLSMIAFHASHPSYAGLPSGPIRLLGPKKNFSFLFRSEGKKMNFWVKENVLMYNNIFFFIPTQLLSIIFSIIFNEGVDPQRHSVWDPTHGPRKAQAVLSGHAVNILINWKIMFGYSMYLFEDSVMFMPPVGRLMQQKKSTDSDPGNLSLRITSTTSVFCFIFYLTILYWFCHTSTWIRHRLTRVPHPEPPFLLPPRTIPLGHPRKSLRNLDSFSLLTLKKEFGFNF